MFLLAIILHHYHRISNSSNITKAVAAAVSQHPLKQHHRSSSITEAVAAAAS